MKKVGESWKIVGVTPVTSSETVLNNKPARQTSTKAGFRGQFPDVVDGNVVMLFGLSTNGLSPGSLAIFSDGGNYKILLTEKTIVPTGWRQGAQSAVETGHYSVRGRISLQPHGGALGEIVAGEVKYLGKDIELGGANKQAGEQFLAANKTKEGVVTLPSGLQYKILKEGTGPKPTAADTVVCNYRGTLLDGTEFDSSYKGGQPAAFGVTQVIKGWTEALLLMPAGSKWQVFVPAELAYGERSPGGAIGPNSTLIFEIDLLSIKDKNP